MLGSRKDGIGTDSATYELDAFPRPLGWRCLADVGSAVNQPPAIRFLPELREANLQVLAVLDGEFIYLVFEFVKKATVGVEQHRTVAVDAPKEQRHLILVSRLSETSGGKGIGIDHCRHDHCHPQRNSFRRSGKKPPGHSSTKSPSSSSRSLVSSVPFGPQLT